MGKIALKVDRKRGRHVRTRWTNGKRCRRETRELDTAMKNQCRSYPLKANPAFASTTTTLTTSTSPSAQVTPSTGARSMEQRARCRDRWSVGAVTLRPTNLEGTRRSFRSAKAPAVVEDGTPTSGSSSSARNSLSAIFVNVGGGQGRERETEG